MDILVQTFVGVLLLANIFIIYYQFRESLYKLYDQYSPDQFRRSLELSTVSGFDDQILVEEKSYRVQSISDVVNLRQYVGRPFQVYVHDLNSSASPLAQSFHAEMKRSPYATKEVKNACFSVYIAVDDTLPRLPFSSTNETGVIVIFIDKKVRDKEAGEKQTIFVGMSDAIKRSNSPLDLNLYTNVMIPDPKNYEHFSVIYPFRQRPHLLSLFVSTSTRYIQEAFSIDSNTSLIELKCRGSTSVPLGFCEDDEFRATTLNNSVFTMLMPKMERFSQRFYESLLYGAIPVVVSDDLSSLPFAQRIRWNKAVVHIPSHFLFEIEKILQKIATPQILELRRNGRFYFENHFADTKVLTRSLLTSIRNQLRLPPPLEQAYRSNIILSTGLNNSTLSPPIEEKEPIIDLDEDLDYVWNVNPVYLDTRPLHPIRAMSHVLADMDSVVPGLQTLNVDNKHFAGNLSGNYVVEKFTAIMPTFRRDKQLCYTLEMLNGTRFLDSVIVLWNDIARPIPSDLIPTISVPIHVVNVSVNSLNSRFLPLDLIRTEAVFNMDDDFNTHRDVVEFSFRVWRENRHAIVGPTFRMAYMQKPGVGVYNAHSSCQQNLVLTGGAFLHRVYHYAYTHMLNPLILDHITTNFNCEDIAANFLVSHLTRRPEIKTTPISDTSGKVVKSGGLHQRGKSHYQTRSECVAMFVKIFGYNPLIMSEWRADSLLYRSSSSKCYKTT
ncbi:Exostosin and EXTL2 domain containing protein [Aphelenchoides besseyi]|nr:Exostosin and EXTL2 domain containing protein [Aphelenchoides besseyi]